MKNIPKWIGQDVPLLVKKWHQVDMKLVKTEKLTQTNVGRLYYRKWKNYRYEQAKQPNSPHTKEHNCWMKYTETFYERMNEK